MKRKNHVEYTTARAYINVIAFIIYNEAPEIAKSIEDISFNSNGESVTDINLSNRRLKRLIITLKNTEVSRYVTMMSHYSRYKPTFNEMYFRLTMEGVMKYGYLRLLSFNNNPKTSFVSQSFHDTMYGTIDRLQIPFLYKTIYLFLLELATAQSVVNDKSGYTIKKDGTVSFYPKGKKRIINDEGHWTRDNRQEISLGKAVRHILSRNPYKITPLDQHTELITSKIRSKYVFDATIKIVEGDDIPHYYHWPNVADSDIGTLSDSCMKHDHCQEYLKFYARNPEKIKMLVAVDNNDKVVGRALLWLANFTKEGYKGERLFMDRVYGSQITTQAFIDYASQHNIIRKKHQNYHDTASFVAPNNEEFSDYAIEIRDVNIHETMPYMDTFKYGEKSGDETMNLFVEDNGEDVMTFTSTNGNIEGGDNVYSEYHDSYISRNSSVWSDYHDSYLHEEDAIYSHNRSDYIATEISVYTYNGYDEPEDDVREIEVGPHAGSYALYDDCCLDYEDRYILSDESAYSDLTGRVYHESEMQYPFINGTCYTLHKDESVQEMYEKLGVPYEEASQS